MIASPSPDGILLSRATEAHLDGIRAWLSHFPQDVQTRCDEWMRPARGTWVAFPDPGISRFRLDPADQIERLFGQMRRLSRTLPDPGRVIWLVENLDNRGLDDFELRALLGVWLDLEHVTQVDSQKPVSRIIVVGRLRTDYVGLALHLVDPRHSGENLDTSLRIIEQQKLPISSLFVSHTDAQYLLEHPRHSVTRRLRRVVKSRLVQLALWVPASRNSTALRDLRREASPLQDLSESSDAIRQVCFEDTAAVDPPARNWARLRKAGIVCDSSLVSAYVPGAFQPLPFDVRLPAAIWDPDAAIELVRHPLDVSDRSAGEVWNAFWQKRLGRKKEPFIHLLDFKQMERYFSSLPSQPHLSRVYHEHRIYNWPPADPLKRSTLLDLGPLVPLTLETTAHLLNGTASKLGRRWKVVGLQSLLEAARTETSRRVGETELSLLAQQVEAHHYLSEVDAEARPREDVVDFMRFIPDRLGRVLEIGSGNGQLARLLRSRAEKYTCADLFPRGEGAVSTDVHRLPFAPESFTHIIANNILEHLYDPLACLDELHRVLRTDGSILALIPLDGLNRGHQITSHLWKADDPSIRKAFELSGFRIQRMDTIDLYALGVDGCFPSCNGLVCKVDARKRAA